MNRRQARAAALGLAADAIMADGTWMVAVEERRGLLSRDEAAQVLRQLAVLVRWLAARSDRLAWSDEE